MSRYRNAATKVADALAPGQRKRGRRADGDSYGGLEDSDSDTGGAKGAQAGGCSHEDKEAVRVRGDEELKDDHLEQAAGPGDKVSNEDLMHMLRTIKDSIAGLRHAPVPSAGGGGAHGQQTWSAQDGAGGAASWAGIHALSAGEEALASLLKPPPPHPNPQVPVSK